MYDGASGVDTTIGGQSVGLKLSVWIFCVNITYSSLDFATERRDKGRKSYLESRYV